MSYYFEYILETFDRLYERPEGIRIGYSKQADIQLVQHSEAFFQSKKAQPETLIWKVWEGTRIPFLFADDDSEPIISSTEGGLRINYDLIGNAFFFLSGWQEFYSDERDSHGRYPYSESLQHHHNFTSLPVVNYYFDILKTALEELHGAELPRKLWPNSPLAVFLSHDIDKIKSGWLEEAFTALKQGRILPGLKYAATKVSGKDPWDNVLEILQLEKELGVSSTWFFIPEQGNGNADYPLRQIEPFAEPILNQKGELALHGSLYSAASGKKLLQEKEMFPRSITGNRFHYLKFEPKKFTEVLEKSKLDYDSSLGFAEHVGFRNGFCFPFQPYHISQKKPADFFEFPLMVMDATLRQKNYMGDHPERMKEVNKVIKEVKKFSGMLSILWHNNYFSECKYAGWGEMYINLVKSLQKEGVQFFTGQQMMELLNES
ncbi:DUF7033 domain-containing protein [Gracilimonas mengyeensis]|uniref:DUF7033 domain-containing protein n=1 Tax=Gracilimonas mengyeensis TaxID=1302730 RepID=A0A521EGT6_9BACT|nr:hypothetical protein [Gracilimonas mengyeensis]SMO83123.1 hypothetical protein SAMN06265219_11240 [Gracilimonas mengyeensis]